MSQIKFYLLAAIVASIPLTVAAEPKANSSEDEASENITRLLKSRLGGVTIAEPTKTPADGIYQTQFGSKFAYLTGNGRYVIIGDMIDLQTQVNLTEMSRRDVARQQLEDFGVEDLAVFPAGGETRAVLNVFTDTSCGYCQKLHQEVPELQKAGIEVRYFPFPRGGSRGPGYEELKQVWCGDDLGRSMDVGKRVVEGDLPAGNCERGSVVDRGYQLGNKLGVAGTPALFTQEGDKIEGYVPHAKLIPMLLNPGN